MAHTKAQADLAFDFFIEAYGVTSNRAAKCLIKDRSGLRAFHDFPAGHSKHIRTTNPIDSKFATVRHRSTKQNYLPEIIQGAEFRDGIKHEIKAA